MAPGLEKSLILFAEVIALGILAYPHLLLSRSSQVAGVTQNETLLGDFAQSMWDITEFPKLLRTRLHMSLQGESSAALLLEFLPAPGKCVIWWILSAKILLGMVEEPETEGSKVTVTESCSVISSAVVHAN